METTTSVEAALAGAAIHILNITPLAAESGTTSLIFVFEFQYKSRGNYIWGNSMLITPAYEMVPSTAGFSVPNVVTTAEIANALIEKAILARDALEDPKDPGRYNYLTLEA